MHIAQHKQGSQAPSQDRSLTLGAPADTSPNLHLPVLDIWEKVSKTDRFQSEHRSIHARRPQARYVRVCFYPHYSDWTRFLALVNGVAGHFLLATEILSGTRQPFPLSLLLRTFA